MIKIIDTKFSVYSEVKLVGMADIEQDGKDFRTYLSLRKFGFYEVFKAVSRVSGKPLMSKHKKIAFD